MTRDGFDKQSAPNEIELAIDQDKVAGIIEKARMFDVKEGMTDPDSGSNATDDNMRDVLEDLASDPTYQELLQLIRDLNEDEQISLVALAWIGRGSFGPEELEEALTTARSERTNRTEDYLLGMPLRPDYLEEGLDRLGYSVEDAEDEALGD